jgi:maltooligosyltrehalose synthase
VPRLVASLLNFNESLDVTQSTVMQKLLSEEVWGDTAILLPADLLNCQLRNVLTGQSVVNTGSSLLVSDLLRQFPVAILTL